MNTHLSYVPTTILSALEMLIHLLLVEAQWDRRSFDKKTKFQRN